MHIAQDLMEIRNNKRSNFCVGGLLAGVSYSGAVIGAGQSIEWLIHGEMIISGTGVIIIIPVKGTENGIALPIHPNEDDDGE